MQHGAFLSGLCAENGLSLYYAAGGKRVPAVVVEMVEKKTDRLYTIRKKEAGGGYDAAKGAAGRRRTQFQFGTAPDYQYGADPFSPLFFTRLSDGGSGSGVAEAVPAVSQPGRKGRCESLCLDFRLFSDRVAVSGAKASQAVGASAFLFARPVWGDGGSGDYGFFLAFFVSILAFVPIGMTVFVSVCPKLFDLIIGKSYSSSKTSNITFSKDILLSCS